MNETRADIITKVHPLFGANTNVPMLHHFTETATNIGDRSIPQNIFFLPNSFFFSTFFFSFFFLENKHTAGGGGRAEWAQQQQQAHEHLNNKFFLFSSAQINFCFCFTKSPRFSWLAAFVSANDEKVERIELF